MDLKQARVVIYGAASDVGRACTRDWADRGATLILIDTDESALSALAAGLGEAPIHSFTARAGDWGAVAAIASACGDIVDAIDILITCPMALDISSFEDSAPSRWDEVITENLLGPVFASKAFLPLLKAAGKASVVHAGSIDGIHGNPQVPSYSVAKGGILPLIHVMASELARFGIRVNGVARAMALEPGTPINPMLNALLAHTPIGRPAYPSEIAAVIRFLTSDEASYVSGVIVPVDGGRIGITAGTRSAVESEYRAPVA